MAPGDVFRDTKGFMAGASLVWIDMEMSGLDVSKEHILEIAVLITDGDLEIIAEGPSIVIHQPDGVLDGMDQWNRSHHGQSGLVDRVRTSTVTDAEAEASVLDFLKQHIKERSAPLAGNSVHQDRRFLAKYMPAIDAFLHYRIVDVSSVKELVGRGYPEAYSQRPGKKATHRALDDIRESIEELRYYRRVAFR